VGDSAGTKDVISIYSELIRSMITSDRYFSLYKPEICTDGARHSQTNLGHDLAI